MHERYKAASERGSGSQTAGEQMQKNERAGEDKRGHTGQAGTMVPVRMQYISRGWPARLGEKDGPMLHPANLISLPASVPRLHLARQSLTGFIRWDRGYRWMAVG